MIPVMSRASGGTALPGTARITGSAQRTGTVGH